MVSYLKIRCAKVLPRVMPNGNDSCLVESVDTAVMVWSNECKNCWAFVKIGDYKPVVGVQSRANGEGNNFGLSSMYGIAICCSS